MVDRDAQVQAPEDVVVGAEPLGSDSDGVRDVHFVWHHRGEKPLPVQLDDLGCEGADRNPQWAEAG